MNSVNREVLLQEYAEANRRPLQMKINNEDVIIPAEYIQVGSNEEIQKNFLRDYFDEQKKEWNRYKQAGVQPRKIEMNGAVYVVPFKLRDSKRKDTEVVELVLRRAKAKYNKAISLTRKLNRAFPNRKYRVEIAGEHVKNMEAAYNRYLLAKYKQNAKVAAVKAIELVASGARFIAGKNPPFELGEIGRAAKKLAVGSLIVGTAAVGLYGTYRFVKEKQNKKAEMEELAELAAEFGDEAVSQADYRQAEKEIKDQKAPVAKKDTKKKDLFKVGPKPAKIEKFNRSEAEKSRLFKRYMNDIFASEGGYADKTIDQPTNMGIIQSTLDVYRKRYPNEAAKFKFPKTVKSLKKKHAMEVYRKLYFDQYKIGDYRNESIGMLVYDIYVNHTPSTAKQFIDQALKAARKAGAEVDLPQSTNDRVAIINSLAVHPKGEAAFYEQIMKERRFHMYKNTTLKVKKGEIKESRFAAGLRNRANKYNDRYVATGFQEKNNIIQLAMSEKHR